MPKYHIDFSDKVSCLFTFPCFEANPFVYRIVSDETFVNKTTKKIIRKGDKGGYVSSEDIIPNDTEDTAWVFPGGFVAGSSSIKKDSAILDSKIFDSNISEYSIVTKGNIFKSEILNSKININGFIYKSRIYRSFCMSAKEKTLNIKRLNIEFSTIIASYESFSVYAHVFDINYVNLSNSKVAFREPGDYFIRAEYENALLEYMTDFDLMLLLDSRYRYCHYYKKKNNTFAICFCGGVDNSEFKIDVNDKTIADNALRIFPFKASPLSSLFLKETDKICKNFLSAISKFEKKPFSEEKKSTLIAAEFFFLMFAVMENSFSTKDAFEKVSVNLKDKTIKENGIFFVSEAFLRNLFKDPSTEKKILSLKNCCVVAETLPF